MSKTFSSKSNAARAAASVGLGRANCYQTADGRWSFKALAVDLGAAFVYPEAAPVPAPVAQPAAEPAKPTTSAPAYKDFQLYGRSVALSPVATVHNFLNAHGASLSRKEALFELSKLGVNYATARTQYQRWFSTRAK